MLFPPPALPLLAALQLSASAPAAHAPATPVVYDGRARQVDVRTPRLEGDVTIDGVLDEPVWQQAAMLTGFSLYQPLDQRPAPDSTEVLVWYSPTAMYVGVRAWEPHGAVRATLADRDKIDGDDNVQLLIDTFDDHRRAYVFAVNPLGVQEDGIRSEGSGFVPGQLIPGETTLSPDFLWASRGHVTPWGYEVELRIPFKSLRFPGDRVQQWAFNVVRNVQHSGYQETWTPALKGAASFLAQSGTLGGLTGMERGLVLEVNPEFTTTVNGDSTLDGWRYGSQPRLGGNVRWGVTSNLTLNGTIEPDFSQVEADAEQIADDPRFAILYPEKRPFFVDGIDQFSTPNNLVYTRQIVRPLGAAKLTGKIGPNDVALLSAVDDPPFLGDAPRPVFNILRLRRDIGGQSTAGLIYTDRTQGSDFNRVVGADTRIVFAKLYYVQLQGVESFTRAGGPMASAPLFQAVADRTGHYFGFHYSLIGIGDAFRAQSGFVTRTGYVQPMIANRLSWYGAPGSIFEQWTGMLNLQGTWRYRDFFRGRPVLEDVARLNNTFIFHGGWTVGLQPAASSYAFDPDAYASYRTTRASGAATDTVAYDIPGRLPAFGVKASVATPRFETFTASVSGYLGRDPDFFELAPVHRADASAQIDWLPTPRLRATASYLETTTRRWRDGSIAGRERIPRLKVEYQLARPVFVRFIGQYDALVHSALRDPRTGAPILVQGDSTATAVGAVRDNAFRVDWLFSYQPTPGTVFFAGYGSSLTEPQPLAFGRLHRVDDGFFVKLSYQFRL